MKKPAKLVESKEPGRYTALTNLCQVPQSPEKTLDYTHRDYERVLDVVPLRPDYGVAII